MLRIGIVGMGVIGTAVAKAASGPAYPLDELIPRSDMIVEAATQAALREFGPAVLEAGKHLMVLSVGALVGVLDDWARLAEVRGCRILVPSGAIAGLDGMKGAREGAVTAVTMETRKPPRGLAGAPYVVERAIDLDAIREETLIFEGPASQAVRAFPANVN